MGDCFVETTGAAAVTPSTPGGPVGSIRNRGWLGGWLTLLSGSVTLNAAGNARWLSGSGALISAVTGVTLTGGALAAGLSGSANNWINIGVLTSSSARFGFSAPWSGVLSMDAFSTSGGRLTKAFAGGPQPRTVVATATPTSRDLWIDGVSELSGGAPSAASITPSRITITPGGELHAALISTRAWTTGERALVERYLRRRMRL
jgi:hypothetical protein